MMASAVVDAFAARAETGLITHGLWLQLTPQQREWIGPLGGRAAAQVVTCVACVSVLEHPSPDAELRGWRCTTCGRRWRTPDSSSGTRVRSETFSETHQRGET